MILLTPMDTSDGWVLTIQTIRGSRIEDTVIVEANDKVSAHRMARLFCVAINENSPDLATRIVAGRPVAGRIVLGR